MASKAEQLHFILIPLMAQGHLIPMVDISKLLAQHGIVVTIVSTPQNVSRFQKTIYRARSELGLDIRVAKFVFPFEEVGLPRDCETLDTLPSKDLLGKFYDAVDKLQEPLERFLELQEMRPSCIISDRYLSWTSSTAKKFKVPRIVFHGMSCFSLLSSHNIRLHGSHLSVSSDSKPFVIPGIPQKIELTRAQLPGSFLKLHNLDYVRDKIQEAESEAFGVIVNSFQELENGFEKAYVEAIKKKVWCIGPVSLCNKHISDKFERGSNSNIGISETKCLKFLDAMKPRSVIYVCLGSLCRLIPGQLIELGLGLEQSGKPFIWVVKTEETHRNKLNEWLKHENFEERVKGRGLVIKGWAPQTMILSHNSIGGFLTHCGWNSTIEGVCSGVPMITWPLFAEQFFNEKLIIEVLKIGVRIGVEIPVRWGDEEKVGVLVKKDRVVRAIEMLMNNGDDEESEIRWRRAGEFADMARKAVEEGGSSHTNMLILIKDVLKAIDIGAV